MERYCRTYRETQSRQPIIKPSREKKRRKIQRDGGTAHNGGALYRRLPTARSVIENRSSGLADVDRRPRSYRNLFSPPRGSYSLKDMTLIARREGPGDAPRASR